MICHSLYTLQEVIVPNSWCAPLQHFQVCLLLARKGSETTLDSQLCLTMEVGFDTPYILLPEIIVPSSWSAPLQHFQLFLILARKVVKKLWNLSSD